LTYQYLYRRLLTKLFTRNSAQHIPINSGLFQSSRLVLESLEDRTTPAGFSQFVDPDPSAGDKFGAFVVPLSTGNVVIAAPDDSAGGTDAGAVYLFSGSTGDLISTLLGSQADDQIGLGGAVALANGNYVVNSPLWNNGSVADAGAVTWGNGTTGISGTVSASNSLVGTTADDYVGSGDDGDYIDSGYSYDYIGAGGVLALSNGNYVVDSSAWNNGSMAEAGAVTWGNGTTGVSGTVSASNSLVGTIARDEVGNAGAVAFTNGNYVVSSIFWNNGSATDAGAVTWGNGTTGISGTVSASNSLVGTTAGDAVGDGGVLPLSNGNYVVGSQLWNNGSATQAGAATWGNGATGISGPVSTSNSLVGSVTNDKVGYYSTALTNGNYVVDSPDWNNLSAPEAGAATWGNGTIGTTGTVSAANSLVGTSTDENVGNVAALSNGNYVVESPDWNNGLATKAGAVTWGNGTTGTSGIVSASNSLVGTTTGDQVGGVTPLPNGNYLVVSPFWNNGSATEAGAVTWVNGATEKIGIVSTTNSLVGTRSDDEVGYGGVTVLSNGNYVVVSPFWNNGSVTKAGAVTWRNEFARTIGTVSASNSLVGTSAYDQVGEEGVVPLSNGNYVVESLFWTNGTIFGAGAATWGNGATGTIGKVSATNSLVGSTESDEVGTVFRLSDGNYLVQSTLWANGSLTDAGAVTWENGSNGVKGVVSAFNSAIGITSSSGLQVSPVLDNVNGTFIFSFINVDKVLVGSQNSGLTPLEESAAPKATLLHDVGTKVASVGSSSQSVPSFVLAGAYVYFPVAIQVSPGSWLNQLWVTNGTAAGTREINQSTISDETYNFDLTAVGGTMYFVAEDSHGHFQLWSYSGVGTPKKITVGTASNPSPSSLLAVGNTLYFAALDGTGEVQLWSYGGSGSPIEIKVGTGSQPDPSNLTAVGSTIYFIAEDGSGNNAVWSYTGSGSSTEIGGDYTSTNDLTALGDTLYFSAEDQTGADMLWEVTNGSTTAAEIPSGINTYSGPTLLTAEGDTLYFNAANSSNNQDLWSYSGGGTPSEIKLGIYVDPTDLTPVDSTLYFIAENIDDTGNSLFSYSGSSLSVLQIVSDSVANPDVTNLTAVDNDLYFAAFDSSKAYQLWKFNGETAPTTVTVDPKGPSDPDDLSAVGNKLYLSDDDGSLGQEPWVLNVGSAPTVTVTDPDGTYNGQPFSATVTVNGVATLDGVTPKLAYHIGSTTAGTLLTGAPSRAGTYTVVATYAGSAGYLPADAHTTFTISPANTILYESAASGLANGKPFRAIAAAIGIGGAPVSGTFKIAYTDSFTHTTTKIPPTIAGNYSVSALFTSNNPDYSNATITNPRPFSIIPNVSPSSEIIPISTTTLVITGYGFDPNLVNDSVTLSSGSGTVIHATATTLTIKVSDLLVGSLFAIIQVDGVSSMSTQVATVFPV
jgi:hypothetical protein